ncbi:uncharacterized protein O3C94_018392 [Discoglossus pictus]
MFKLHYPSKSQDSTDIEDIIASQNVISRAMHTYIIILAPLGLLAGIFSLVIIIRNNVKQRILENLDFYILNLAITDIIIILYSFTIITRPDYLEVTNLSCGALSSFFNLSYFYSNYLLLLMFPTFIIFNSSTNVVATKIIQSPLVCVSVTLFLSLLMSLLAVSLMGTYNDLYKLTYCQLDPLNAKPEYDFVKFAVGFCVPSFFLLLFFLLLVVCIIKAEDDTMKKEVQSHIVILINILIVFSCRLFYNIMLLRRAQLKLQHLDMSTREELLMNIAELLMFSGSCFNLIFILTLHRPCQLGAWKALLHIKKQCCRMQTSNDIEM